MIGSPPPSGMKKLVPKFRSIIRYTSATVITGKASSRSTWTTKLIHTNIGIRSIFMPGARRFTIVTKKFSAAGIEAIPRIWRPMTKKKMLSAGEEAAAVAGIAIPLAAARVVGSGGLLLDGALAAGAIIAVGLVRVHGRIEGWKLVLVLIAIFALVSVAR